MIACSSVQAIADKHIVLSVVVVSRSDISQNWAYESSSTEMTSIISPFRMIIYFPVKYTPGKYGICIYCTAFGALQIIKITGITNTISIANPR